MTSKTLSAKEAHYAVCRLPVVTPLRRRWPRSALAGPAGEPLPAGAQTNTDLVSNFGKGTTSAQTVSRSGGRVAQQFTTGPYPRGYRLHGIALDGESFPSSRTLKVTVHTSRADGTPGPRVKDTNDMSTDLTLPNSFGDTTLLFTNPSTIQLDADTAYVIRLVCVGCSDNTETVSVAVTDSDDEDHATGDAWVIADTSLTEDSGTWTESANALAMKVIGSQAPPYLTATNRAALEALYDATGGDSDWSDKTNWKTDDEDWYGVTTDGNGNVTELDLSDNNLRGSIPTELGNLTNLTDLELSYNRLEGGIPAALGSLTNLEILDLESNRLEGSIPTELGNLTNLTELVLLLNRLEGSIPTELGNLTNLTDLELSSNSLEGPIPTELGNLTNLTDLGLSYNALSGPIPTELGNLTNLTSLLLDGNRLSGPIPTELGNLTNLRQLTLERNALSGPIPAALGNLTNLTNLVLSSNRLSGPIPAAVLRNLTNLRILHLDDNLLEGSLPALGNLAKLQELYLHNNNLSGPLPTGLEKENLPDLYRLLLHNNPDLTGSIPTNFSTFDTFFALRIHNTQITVPDHAALQTWLEGVTFTTGSRESTSGIFLADDNWRPVGLWADEETLYVSDEATDTIFAYRRATGTHDTAKDIVLSDENSAPQGIWSDGTTLWVADFDDDKLYAYTLADGSRDADKDIDLQQSEPRDLWSDGTTVWVVDSARSGRNVYAYTLADGMRDTAKDFPGHFSRGHHDADEALTDPRGLWSDGTTLYLMDGNEDTPLLRAYNLADGLHDADAYKVLAPENRAPRGLWRIGLSLYVVDADDRAIYFYPSLPAIELLDARQDRCEVAKPLGLWLDSESLYVGDLGPTDGPDRIRAYNLSSGQLESTKAITASANGWVTGLWGDGTTLWAADYPMTLYTDSAPPGKLYAYDLATRQPDPTKTFALADPNRHPNGLASDGTTLWVGDMADRKAYAYEVATGQRRADRDVHLETETYIEYRTGERAPTANHLIGLWTNGTTLWTTGYPLRSVYAYDVATERRVPSADIVLAEANAHPLFITSDGATLVVGDGRDCQLYTYPLPPVEVPQLATENERPRALDDHVVLEGEPVGRSSQDGSPDRAPTAPAHLINVLANDSDPDGDVLRVVATTQPAHGTVEILDAGLSVRYTPEAGFVGTDHFTYTVSDGQGGTDTATVTVGASDDGTESDSSSTGGTGGGGGGGSGSGGGGGSRDDHGNTPAQATRVRLGSIAPWMSSTAGRFTRRMMWIISPSRCRMRASWWSRPPGPPIRSEPCGRPARHSRARIVVGHAGTSGWWSPWRPGRW